jgi:hypothetical protein
MDGLDRTGGASAARPPRRPWRATVPTGRPVGPKRVALADTHGYGATEAEALAVALASMLRREG